MPSRSLSTYKSSESDLFPSYNTQWKEYDDLNDPTSSCTLKTWESIWYTEKERDFYHYGANTNEPRIYDDENERIAENPNVGDVFDVTVFMFLIVMVLGPYIYGICTRRKHIFITKDTPIITYHYRLGKTKLKHRTTNKHSDINIADLQNKGLEKQTSGDSIQSAGGESMVSVNDIHSLIVRRGSVFMAGGIVLASEKHKKTYEEAPPSCFCGPCYRWKKRGEKTNRSSSKISKNKVAPEDFETSSSSNPTSSTISSSTKSSL